MASHMKTTIEISDALFRAARKAAAREGTTLRALVEEGLRRVLEARSGGSPFKLHTVTFGGDGLAAEAGDGTWERIRALAYEDRGA